MNTGLREGFFSAARLIETTRLPLDSFVIWGHGHSRVGWARDYSPLQYKAQLTFPPGFSTPRPFSSLIAFLVSEKPVCRKLRIREEPFLGTWVSRGCLLHEYNQ